MGSIAVAVIKVIVSVLVTLLGVFALFAAVGFGAGRYADAPCGSEAGVFCGVATFVGSWWFVVWMLATLPIFVLALVYFVRKWSVPGTRGKVVGAIGVLWGGGLLVRRFLFGGDTYANADAQLGADFALVFAGVMLVVGCYFLLRKVGPRATP